MPFIKIIQTICDNCLCGINYFPTVETSKRFLLKEGGIIKGKKCFCDEKCEELYKRKIKHEKK